MDHLVQQLKGGASENTMRTYITACLVAIVIAIVAAVARSSIVQEFSSTAFLLPLFVSE
jgi:hypothetical protein